MGHNSALGNMFGCVILLFVIIYLVSMVVKSTRPSVHRPNPSFHPFIRPSFHPFILPSIHSSILPSIHSSIHSFVHPSIHSFFHPFIRPSFHPFILQSFHPSIHSFSILPSIRSSLPSPTRPRFISQKK